jgi:type IV secretory pathway VirB6-like protein
MSKGWIVAICGFSVIFLFGLIVLFYCVGVLNTEGALRIQIEAKQVDNTNEYDNMWKKISQVAQVTDAQKNALKEIFVSYAEARTGNGDNGSIMKWIQESVPNVDTKTFEVLQNTIINARDNWVVRQKELIEYDRVHDTPFTQFPQSIILNLFGRKRTEITVVTSTRTERAFETGKDDDVDVMPKKTATEKQ